MSNISGYKSDKKEEVVHENHIVIIFDLWRNVPCCSMRYWNGVCSFVCIEVDDIWTCADFQEMKKCSLDNKKRYNLPILLPVKDVGHPRWPIYV